MLIVRIKLSQHEKKVLLVLLCTVFLIFLLSFLEPGYAQICIKARRSQPPDCTSYNVVAYFLWQFVGVTNDYGAAITALATGLLAVITYKLVQLGRNQGVATQRQLRAYVFPKAVELRDFGEGETPSLIIRIQNYGSTPAYKFKQASRGRFVDFPLSAPPPESADDGEETMTLAPTDYVLATPDLKAALTKTNIAGIASKNGASCS